MIYHLYLLIISAIASSTAIYVYKDNPFTGQLLPASYFTIGGKEYKHVIPYFTEVYYPKVKGEYAAIFFIPGLFALVPPQLYVDTLTQLAGRGYVVMAISTDLPTVGDGGASQDIWRVKSITDKTKETLEWLRYNLNEKVLPEQKVEARANWTYLGLGGHSAGASTALDIMMDESSIAKAVAYMEPFSYDLKAPFDSGVPSLAYGTQYSEESPRCCIPGLDYVHFYKNLGCPKIQMNATGFGHCDILTDGGWEMCHLAHFCKTVKTNDRVLYRHTVSGIMAAFFGTYVQGNRDQLQYVTNATLIPIHVADLLSDVNC